MFLHTYSWAPLLILQARNVKNEAKYNYRLFYKLMYYIRTTYLTYNTYLYVIKIIKNKIGFLLSILFLISFMSRFLKDNRDSTFFFIIILFPLFTIIASWPSKTCHVAIACVAVPLLHTCAVIGTEIMSTLLARM